MLKEQCISVTDLRLNTKKCLSGLNKGEKYVFINNKPTAVLVSIEDFESFFKKPMLIELSSDDVSNVMKEKIELSKKRNLNEFVDL